MKKIFNSLFIIIFVFGEINSECNYEQTASTASECLKKSNETTYCCFISPINDPSSPSMCYPFPKDKYYGFANINFNNKTYSIECGIGSRYMGTNWNFISGVRKLCGEKNPNDYTECIKDSTENNSCCYYESEEMNERGCYWLGIKYQAKVTKNKYTFICGSNFLKYLKVLSLLIISLYL